MSASRLHPGAGGPPSFRLDVFVEGEPLRRDAHVEIRDGAIIVEDRSLLCESVFWVSRRAGLLLLFAHDYTAAIKGPGDQLEDVAHSVERVLDRDGQRRMLEPVAREVIVCTAGSATAGRMGGERIQGLHLAIVTQQALHLVSREHRTTIPWPVGSANRKSSTGQTGEVLVLSGDDLSLRLLYLFPEEVQATRRVALSTPPELPASATLEMFARSQVAPQVPARLPEFSVSIDTMRDVSARTVERVPVRSSNGGPLGRGFFEDLFQELGEIALGPLMLRKSAAAGAESLARAVEAMDAEQLHQDTKAAVATATDRLVRVYTGELERVLESKRVPEEGDDLRVTAAERSELDERMQAAVETLNPLFQRVARRQSVLLERLETLESGPPDVADEQVEAAAAEWRKELQKLDRAYGTAWRELLDDVAGMWSDRLLPRLERADGLPSRKTPEWVRPVAIIVIGTAVVAITAVWLF